MLFTHTAEKRYMVGIDLSEDYCQISWSDMGSEPKTLTYREGEEDFNIPMTLLKKRGTNLWFCGKDAIEHAKYREGELVSGILQSAVSGKGVEIEGQEYDPRSLLALYVRRVLAVFASVIPTEKISVLTFTAKVMDEPLVEALRKVRDYLNLPVEEVAWENHGNSFYSYMSMQSGLLREKDTLLCEYDGAHAMHVSRLVFNYNTTPVVSYIKEREYPEMSIVSLEAAGGDAEKDAAFLNILKKEAPAGEISSIYLIGDGWKDHWMKDSLRYAAFHRRIFLGNNLFSKGAAYSALSHKNPPEDGMNFFFLGENKLTSNIGMLVLEGGRSSYVPVMNAGVDWYEAQEEKEVYLAGGNEVTLVITPLTGGKVMEETVALEPLPDRPQRMTRLLLRFTLLNPHTLRLYVEDLGFGTLFPATDMTWEKTIDFSGHGGENL